MLSIDEAKQKGYGIGIFMLTLISQCEVSERLGVTAMFYNKLHAKEREFALKRQEYAIKVASAQKRHKPIPKPSKALSNYDKAAKAAIISWDEALKVKNSKIEFTIGGAFIGFWRKEQKILSSLYGFTDEDFKTFNKSEIPGYLFRSIRVANVLIARLEHNLQIEKE